jgi:hypothetical protein
MNFLIEYNSYAEQITDAPLIFHQFVGIGIVGASIGNKIFLNYGDNNLYPNCWIVLLAPSSAYRKTTALNIGKRILRNVDERLILPDEWSQEKLVEELQDFPQGAMFSSEFLRFIKMLDKDYMSGAKAFLTEIFDCPDKYSRKIKQKVISVSNISLSIFSATTLNWFLQAINESDLAGGFLPRFLFVPATSKEKTLPVPPPADIHKQNELVKLLREIYELKGEATILPEALEYYKRWYHRFENEYLKNLSILSPFFTRLCTYALKFSIIYQVSNDKGLKITEDAMKQATQTANFLANKLEDLVKEFTFTNFARNKKKVLDLIRGNNNEGIDRSKLLQLSHCSATQLNEIIRTLCEERSIRIETLKKDGKPLTMYYINDNTKEA